MSAPLGTYRWWPSWHPGIAEFDGRRVYWPTAIAEGVFVAILALPPVVRATGVPPVWLFSLYVVHCLLGALNSFVLHPATHRSARAFHAMLFLDLWWNVQGMVSLAAVSGDPKSFFWLGMFVYAAVRGSSRDLEPSLGYVAALLFAPLASIPFFLAQGHGLAAATAPPVIVGLFSAFGYHILAGNAAAWRSEREAKERALAELRNRTLELEREQLARDLHDSVGSALAASRLYADIIERRLDDPEQLRTIATTLRDTAVDGLTDLRSVLSSLAAADGSLDSVSKALVHIGGRFERVSAAGVEVDVVGNVARPISGATRVALVRIFQEAVNNAIRHGRASRICARLEAREDVVALSLEDDGTGFDPKAVARGIGLDGMRKRASELGGALQVDASPGIGTRVRVTLPVSAA